jgi:hypothetical protein
MNYASISIDRREAYYARAADLIAKDPLWFYARAEAGRRIQAAIKPKDLQPFTPADTAPAVVAPEIHAAPVVSIHDAPKRARR